MKTWEAAAVGIRRLLSLASLIVAAALAQTSTADLAGTISDESGGVVRKVEVTLTSQDTGAQRITHTDDAGRYYFEQLPPGSYRLTAQAVGFQTEVAPRVELTVGRKAVLDMRLRVGGIRTEAIVTTGAGLVDTRDSSLSNVMPNAAIRELPLNGRDVNQLALLEPGVVMTRRAADSGSAQYKLVINGSQPSQNSFLLDGSDINDALREFRVLTNSYGQNIQMR